MATVLDADIDAKWESVKNNLDAAIAGPPDMQYITFSSGSSSGAYPYSVASSINSKLGDYLADDANSGRLGIVAMDYPGWEGLIKKMIDRN